MTERFPGQGVDDGESACKRGSVTAPWRCRRPSIYAAYPGIVPRGTGGLPVPPARPCSRWGLPAARVAPGAGALLPHRFTLACDRRAGPSAVCSLLPDPTGHSVLALASTLPCGAPTFLDPVDAGPRPPGRLTVTPSYRGDGNPRPRWKSVTSPQKGSARADETAGLLRLRHVLVGVRPERVPCLLGAGDGDLRGR